MGLDGRELIDFARGISIVDEVHLIKQVVEAIIEQAGEYLHTRFNVVTSESCIPLYEELAEMLKPGKKTNIMLISAGAEIIENALKIGKQAIKR
ncbi:MULTISPECIES: aminotransferase class III-fold pyridoxal phosphate-dependent enzyme [unclassified Polaribacter]|uniref:aminotransferase class III-fold pyridoxal phosphate-dependent enzyme n=1 Tax=unclassified Polaribacter TaxID=196858 RepID=UPI0011BD5F0D|nr:MULTISPECIES: aminotransferase class III-fold pyridoxal phosphate-dependent enzyme [unclassified Polaribacter]TXD52109.1 aminotransferase class III-fold pyridoxal phosphate-dependent enzyme [Polaribacter sp. IC063]TXD59963.1 aminotransferase class III-fold pyridoxal phosphate-dependent enzyme [Polaribacter sp. IC066]